MVHWDGRRLIVHVRDDILNADDPRAKRLGVADNLIAAMDWNPDGELLAALAAEDTMIADLARQENASLKALLDGLSRRGKPDPNSEWEGMPEFENEDNLAIMVKVYFLNETDREKFLRLINYKEHVGDTKGETISTWYPERPEKVKNQLGNGLVYTYES